MWFWKIIKGIYREKQKTCKVMPGDGVKEQFYAGVSMSILNEIAKSVSRGIRVTIDEYGLLVFHYTSNSQKTLFKQQMRLDETGKLANLGGHFPGQWWSAADEFAKRVNETVTFKFDKSQC